MRLGYKTIQQLNVGAMAVDWSLQDQRQIIKTTIVHDPTEAVEPDPTVTDAGVTVDVRADIVYTIHSINHQDYAAT